MTAELVSTDKMTSRPLNKFPVVLMAVDVGIDTEAK